MHMHLLGLSHMHAACWVLKCLPVQFLQWLCFFALCMHMQHSQLVQLLGSFAREGFCILSSHVRVKLLDNSSSQLHAMQDCTSRGHDAYGTHPLPACGHRWFVKALGAC